MNEEHQRVITPWTQPEDLLDRKKDADFLENYFHNSMSDIVSPHSRGSFVINLKGQWGTGKSYFLRNFAAQLRNSKHKVVEFDAWQADSNIDPLISLIAAIKDEIETETNASTKISEMARAALKVVVENAAVLAKQTTTNLTEQTLKKLLGEAFEFFKEEYAVSENTFQRKALDASEVAVNSGIKIEPVKSSSFIQQIRTANEKKNAISSFSNKFEKLVEIFTNEKSGCSPFYIFVDELDRCRPTFAIEVLERINHLFNVKGVVFVIGTDSDELEHSIKAVYGSEFDSRSYLNRFFSFTYNLPNPEVTNYIRYLTTLYQFDLSKYLVFGQDKQKETNFSANIEKVLSPFVNNVRDYKHILFMVKTFERSWEFKFSIDLFYVLICATLVFYNKDKILTKSIISERSKPGFEYRLEIDKLRSVEISTNSKHMVTLLDWVVVVSALTDKKIVTVLEEVHGKSQKSACVHHLRDLLHQEYSALPSTKQKSEISKLAYYVDFLTTASKLSLEISPEGES
ncbi:KAP family P-loop NTPase fold protein [Hirschia litorea]|uniref:P-loop NTPase fold protein n=1 Tax=Hirschia litorea TaxID=1199156 RepID=A0ABW2IKM9_9PROT